MAYHDSKNGLYKNKDDSIISGVCSGISEVFKIDVVYIRLLFILLIPVGGIGILIYIILAIVLPHKKKANNENVIDVDVNLK